MRRAMKRKLIVLIIIAMLAVFLYLECRPCEIFYSSVFTTSEETEICLYVIVNSFLPIDREELASQLIEQHQSINGSRGNEVYELHLYRTIFHYKRHWKYDTLFCGPDGKIFHNETY